MPSPTTIAFIGGGNMAGALIGGLRRSGQAVEHILVIEPWAEQRERLAQQHGVTALPAADASLARAALVVWAVKPQSFAEAAAACAAQVGGALQLSVMAGIRSETIAAATGSQRVVRAMPNTPALIGQGIAGLYARPQVSDDERAHVEALLAPTGQTLWVDREDDLDSVTALSGSGPAYVFLFIESMMEAARRMGLSDAQGRALALRTFAGATELAMRSEDPPAVLRERVTSKGGTTFAALESMRADGVGEAIVRAVLAAQTRAAELGRGG
ncbi:pyrroline-5-carboxylate reductase [Rivibacter subsaxonicus]|uniref:Pyrroline-5-carboxylate reductase n=1 Tax=Rivibacter subsaxonicus TaxID=457575 RepID=A0A4Q7VVW0_9BURK|nr:pyrroline-5-carboxylate reductase [Rivibacter subsaxonicus]RZU00817.1 pyrroline-5-carboxylate reductase [Rivibacter subsaxonicus]